MLLIAKDSMVRTWLQGHVCLECWILLLGRLCKLLSLLLTRDSDRHG